MRKVLILALLLIVPSVAYLLFQTGKNKFGTLEILGPKEPVQKTVNGKNFTDTLYHTVGDFQLMDADSQRFDRSMVKGKIYVADFFFSTCKTICPKMSVQMMKVQYAFRNNPDVLILSHTVDPEFDTPSVLKAYAAKHKAISGKWYFLTGDKKELYDLARQSYFITAVEGDGGPDDFIHSELFVLVDKEGRLRGYYDGTDEMEVRRLIGEIKVLVHEYSEKAS